MGTIILLALQLALTLGGFALLWRRLETIQDELAKMRHALETLENGGARQVRPQRLAPASTTTPPEADIETVTETPQARAARAWAGMRRAAPARDMPPSSDDFRIGVALGVAALAPAFGFIFSDAGAAPVSAGVLIAAGMMALALRPAWRVAAWAGAATGAAWAIIGLAMGAAQYAPALFSTSVATAGLAGLVFAYKRTLAPGGLLALAMGAAALLLGAQTGMVGPAGAAFACVALSAAIIGAVNLRLEALHVVAFLATLAGLYVLSGQDAAAIWFTPAAGLTGAAFFGIAAIRVPQLGARGVTLAGTGALGPLAMVATLDAAQHGLSSQYEAGGAYLLLALLFSGFIALAARRRESRLASLGVVLWVLAIAASAAAALGVLAAAPLAVAPAAFACFALLFVMLDDRLPHAAWRALSVVFGAASAVFAAVNTHAVLAEATPWPAGAVVAAAVTAPAALLGTAAWRVRRDAPVYGGAFELLAAALAIVAANLAVRLAFTGGAIRLNPLDFVEAGVHISIWLTAAFVVAVNAKGRSNAPRTGAAAALGAAALGACALAGILWLTPYWTGRSNAFGLPQPLGFALPAIVLAAHWTLLRARGSQVRTRVALGACALLLAATAALALGLSKGVPSVLAALLSAAAFALAVALNFAPGIVMHATRGQYRYYGARRTYARR